MLTQDLLLDLYRHLPDLSPPAHGHTEGPPPTHPTNPTNNPSSNNTTTTSDITLRPSEVMYSQVETALEGHSEATLWNAAYVSLRASLTASEGAVSDVLNALLLHYDLYPTPEASCFSSYVSACTELPLRTVSMDEGELREGGEGGGGPMLIPLLRDDQLLSQGTKRKVK